MELLDKPFRCYSDLSIDVCRQRIEDEFLELESFHTSPLKSTFSESEGALTLHFELYVSWGLPIILDAKLLHNGSNVQLEGHAIFTKNALRYFVIFALSGLLVVPFIFVEWWLILWVIGWYATIIGNTYHFWNTRNELIQTLCNLLR